MDPEICVLSIEHADGRPLAILANYSIHYAGGFVRGEVSADYFGVFARRLEERLGREDGRPPFVGIMSNGTSGNIGMGMGFEKPRPKKDPYVHMDDVGSALAGDVYRHL